MKRLKKELAAAADDEEKRVLQRKLHNAEVDVNYAISYPLMKPYSALYPKSKKSSTTAETDDSDEAKSKPEDVDGPKGDVMVWKMVEQAMEEGTLETLRNSKSREEIPGAPPKKSRPAKTKTPKDAHEKPKKTHAPLVVPANRREARAAAREADDDSDGGFFE
jgi:hypothetical protein